MHLSHGESRLRNHDVFVDILHTHTHIHTHICIYLFTYLYTYHVDRVVYGIITETSPQNYYRMASVAEVQKVLQFIEF